MIEIGRACGNFKRFKEIMKEIKITKSESYIWMEFKFEKNWILRAEFLGLLQLACTKIKDLTLTDPEASEE